MGLDEVSEFGDENPLVAMRFGTRGLRAFMLLQTGTAGLVER